MKDQRALVQGVGALEGIGARCALAYAENGAKVIASGRNEEKLQQLREEAQKRNLDVRIEVSDVTNPDQVNDLFDKAEHELGGTLNLVHFNAGNNMPGKISEMTPDYFEDCWRVGAFAGFLCAQQATSRMMAAGMAGTMLFTGASASMRGRANFGAFNSTKGALRLMAHALAKEVGPTGIHVGHVVVDGGVDGDRLNTFFPKFVAQAREADRIIDIQAIVDAFVFLWKQPESGWSFEIDIRTKGEIW